MGMIRSLKPLRIAAIVSTMLALQPTIAQSSGKSMENMNQELRLTWNASGEGLENRRVVDFMYSPGHGLTDIDFHSITARDWPTMKSPTPDAVARLQVSKETTVVQLQEVIAQIAEKGGYKTVVASVGL